MKNIAKLTGLLVVYCGLMCASSEGQQATVSQVVMANHNSGTSDPADSDNKQKPTNNSSDKDAPTQDKSAPATKADVNTLQKKIEDSLKTQSKDVDFYLSLGIGSLLLNSGVTDYSNSSNILEANGLGRATPQYLVGVSMVTALPNFRGFAKSSRDCKQQSSDSVTSPSTPTQSEQANTVKSKGQENGANAQVNNDADNESSGCALWRRRPWAGFVSLKFSPQASQTINGYVLGGSYAIAHYLNALVGFALTPVNEASPGFRSAASQYVINQQKVGLDLNFNPVAMANGYKNAFDGFPLTDPTGKLIFSGNSLTIHYRGGAVFGVAIPISFSSLFNSKGGT